LNGKHPLKGNTQFVKTLLQGRGVFIKAIKEGMSSEEEYSYHFVWDTRAQLKMYGKITEKPEWRDERPLEEQTKVPDVISALEEHFKEYDVDIEPVTKLYPVTKGKDDYWRIDTIVRFYPKFEQPEPEEQ